MGWYQESPDKRANPHASPSRKRDSSGEETPKQGAVPWSRCMPDGVFTTAARVIFVAKGNQTMLPGGPSATDRAPRITPAPANQMP